MQIVSVSHVFLDRLTTLKHIANAHKDHTVMSSVMLWRIWQAIGGLQEIPWTGMMRIKARTPQVSDDWMCSHTCVLVHTWICIHSLPWVPYGGKKHLSWPTNISALLLLFNLSAFDSKPLEAIISDKWKLYMKINIKSFVREKITLLGNKQCTGLRAMLPVIHISTAFKLLKRLEIIIGHIFFPFFSTQMACLGYLTFTSGL